MNILLVAMGLDIGGAETHVISLAKNLKKKGHHPVVISSGGVYEQELTIEQIPHYKAGLNEKGLKTTLNSINVMKNVIKTENIDLIHAHGRIPAFISKIVSIMTSTSFMTTAHAKFDDSGIYKYMTFWGDEVISVSEDIKKHLTNNFKVKENKITIITNGIDTEKFNPTIDTSKICKDMSITKETTKIIYMSRLSGALANVAKTVMDSIYKIGKSGEDIALIVVGDGDDFRTVEDYSQKINLDYGERLIYVLGKRTDIPEIMAFGDIGVAVSRSALEAMACENPVILAGGEGYMGLLTKDNISVAINNNFTGRTVNEAITVDKVTDELKKVVGKDKEHIREELGKLGREVVMKYFSIDSMTDRTIEIYEKLLNRRK